MADMALIMGTYGAGKTTFFRGVLEVPQLLPALLLDVEGGYERAIGKHCARITSPDKVSDPAKINVLRIDAWTDFTKFYDAVLESIDEDRYKEDQEEWLDSDRTAPEPVAWDYCSFPYKSIAIDSISALVAMNIAHKAGMRNPYVANRTRVEIQHYGQALDAMMAPLNGLKKGYPGLVYLTAHVGERYGRNDRLMGYVPMAFGKLSRVLPSVPDCVGLLEVDKEKKRRVLSFDEYKDEYELKFRGDKIEDIVNPTFKAFYEKFVPSP